MPKEIDPHSRFNFSSATVLVVDRSVHAADITVQILTGFGVHKILRAQTSERAMELLRSNSIDLVLADPELEGEDGMDFIKDLRRSKLDNRYVPVVLLSGHARVSRVRSARDSGANFVVAKPITPAVLMQRLHWIAADKRQFVDVDSGKYVGPDRRFKFEGPPIGSDGRRETDLNSTVGDAGANMSQNEISALLKPQKVSL